MSDRPTVLIADDHPIVAVGLASALKEWYDVVGVVHDLDRVRPELTRLAPNVMLLDLSFGVRSSLKLVKEFRRVAPATRIVILTVHVEPSLADVAMMSGASGFIVKESAPAELRVAIEEALAGRTYVTPLLRREAPRVRADTHSDAPVQPTTIECRILDLLVTGHSQAGAGEQVGLSLKGVHYHLLKLRSALGLGTTAQLVRWYESRRGSFEG